MLGLGLALDLTAGARTIVPAAPATFTMSQLASPNRVYQRSSTTGGGQGKGAGSIIVALSAVTSAGAIYARIRSAADGVTILQASRFITNLPTTGAQSVTVSGIDARLGWFYLDLSGDGVTWQNGTVAVGMGRLVAWMGQSQALRQIAKMPTYTGTNASLSVTLPSYSAVYARYSDGERTLNTPAWAAPADASNYDGTFAAEFLRLSEVAAGVNCALVGHGAGNTLLATWQPGQLDYTTLAGVLSAVGGFEAFYIYIGGSDADIPTPDATLQTQLTGLVNGVTSLNAVRGGSFAIYLCAMASRLQGGSPSDTDKISDTRRSFKKWATNNGATYLEPHDVLLEDFVHQSQAGNIRLAHQVYRAMRPAIGLAGDHLGPQLTSVSRSAGSKDVLLNFSMPNGGSLVSTGAPAPRIQLCYAGDPLKVPLLYDATTPITVGSSSVTIKLKNNLADNQPIDAYIMRGVDPSNSGGNNFLEDGYTNGDGITHGRQIQPVLDALVAAAPVPAASTIVASDTFTGTDGTSLTGRALDTGQTWSGANWQIQSGRAMPTASNNWLVNGYTPGSDCWAEVDITHFSGSNGIWILMRCQAVSPDTYYQMGMSSNVWYCNRTNAGVDTNLYAATGVLPANGETYRLRVEIHNYTHIRAYQNGVLVINCVDNGTALLTGQVGLRQSSSGSTVNTNYHFDNFRAGEL